ncbi:FixH family protein [Actinosynnema sp. NPDC023794]
MRRSVLLALAVVMAVVAVAALAFTSSPDAAPVRLGQDGVTVLLDQVGTGTVAAQVEVAVDVAAVSLYATMPRMGHMTPEVVAERERPGRFRATGEFFSMTGPWVLTVRADDEIVTFDITVG